MPTESEEVQDLREEQTKRVMPLIGGLLDAWDGLSNDFKETMIEEAPSLVAYLDDINRAMELEEPYDNPIY